MTLNQFYDDFVRKYYNQSWNVYCASATEAQKTFLKKKLKKLYKLHDLKNQTLDKINYVDIFQDK